MVVKIRLARIGVKNTPLYQIVIANARSPRDHKHIEKIGYYDPKPDNHGIKQVSLNMERAKFWIASGAQPSDTVHQLLSKAGLLPFKPYKITPRQPKEKKEK
ncbi:30S ribosomal protein S16 [Neoconidiobolus thromboides FSU 785]|nr:30S ribosomal protein S16 [Neoconidiobolus thromboides FSU 785]